MGVIRVSQGIWGRCACLRCFCSLKAGCEHSRPGAHLADRGRGHRPVVGGVEDL